MLGVTVIVLVDASSIEFKTSQQSCVDEFLECPIDSWAADVVVITLARQLIDQLISIKMLVSAEDLFDQKHFLLSLPQATAKQVLFESLDRSLRNLDGFEGLFF